MEQPPCLVDHCWRVNDLRLCCQRSLVVAERCHGDEHVKLTHGVNPSVEAVGIVALPLGKGRKDAEVPHKEHVEDEQSEDVAAAVELLKDVVEFLKRCPRTVYLLADGTENGLVDVAGLHNPDQPHVDTQLLRQSADGSGDGLHALVA